MNEKDKEAFEKWWDEIRLRGQSTFGIVAITWQSACEYKQKEIDELEKEKDYLYKKMENMRDIYKHSERFQAENAQLKGALKNCPILGEVHRDSNDRFKEWNLEFKYVLKELEAK